MTDAGPRERAGRLCGQLHRRQTVLVRGARLSLPRRHSLPAEELRPLPGKVTIQDRTSSFGTGGVVAFQPTKLTLEAELSDNFETRRAVVAFFLSSEIRIVLLRIVQNSEHRLE